MYAVIHDEGGVSIDDCTVLDMGCAQLIIDGKVKVKQGVDITHFERDAVVFADGSKIEADVVVLAWVHPLHIHPLTLIIFSASSTGYGALTERYADILGAWPADAPVWGMDAEGRDAPRVSADGTKRAVVCAGGVPAGAVHEQALGDADIGGGGRHCVNLSPLFIHIESLCLVNHTQPSLNLFSSSHDDVAVSATASSGCPLSDALQSATPPSGAEVLLTHNHPPLAGSTTAQLMREFIDAAKKGVRSDS
ncbi:hypothetical protein MIND_00387700 [Mycena indigotica]|uniref:Uncharacterized protein n=1 Tax=Mycena indigotica TaxID=2126181 RepID=A0A8H6WCV6_9AGAR|nr:uncharacterized protein MIND_00387700 [Mycena indigotica]KAF7310143.1 hypothetical protein MIND_00387700 [Mycena indigotica]